MNLKDDLLYSRTHEWARIEDGTATVGITDHAQCELGDVVYVDLPSVGTELAQNAVFGAVESVKAVSDLYAPVAGTVVAVNSDLATKTELINEDPYGQGWMLKVKLSPDASTDHLLSAADYEAFVQESGH
jgi:glycine cleavage system H protein